MPISLTEKESYLVHYGISVAMEKVLYIYIL